MTVAVFAVQFILKNFWWDKGRVPQELCSDCRIPLFHELIKCAQKQGAGLAVLPGGFFRSDYPSYIASILENKPPKVTVLVGRDNLTGSKLEAWVIAPSGKIRKKILEAWIYEDPKCQAVLDRTDRRFQINNKLYSAYCCGDVIIADRNTHSKAAFVLAHYRASGRNFMPSMRKLGIPTFLSHHVKDPYNTKSFAYKGKYKKYDPKQIRKALYGKSQGLKWVARFYSV